MSVARTFLIISFLILLSGMLIIGTWVGRQIEAGVINRTAAVTALYMDSLIDPHLQVLAQGGSLTEAHQTALDSLLTDTPLGQRVVSFKIWAADGQILYSTNHDLMGQRFTLEPRLIAAFNGEVYAEISDLSDDEHEYERQHWSRLIETYAPVREEGTGTIIAVSEFYHTADELDQEVTAAQRRSWMVVGVATLAMYGLLSGLVGRASNTITTQQRELRDTVSQLKLLLAQNEQLHERVRGAAARTTALNERFLRRVSADVHDGPCQDLALALLRFEEFSVMCRNCPLPNVRGNSAQKDFDAIHTALKSALQELRNISAGLRMPEIDRLSVALTVDRAVRDYQNRTGCEVDVTMTELPESASLPVKITLFRFLQESLTNAFRHAGGAGQRVTVSSSSGSLVVEVADSGPGFDPKVAFNGDQLGIAGMRERVEVLGGSFGVLSAPGQGTIIRAVLPHTLLEMEHG